MVSLTRDLGGRLWEARCIAGKINVRHQTSPGGAWSVYTNIQGGTPTGLFDTVAIACNGDSGNSPNGRLEVLALHTAYQVLYRNWMDSAGNWQTFVAA